MSQQEQKPVQKTMDGADHMNTLDSQALKGAARNIIRQNAQIMKNLLNFVDEHIMVENFGLIPDGDTHRPSPLVIETLTALLKALQAQSDKQAMHVANDYSKKGETWILRQNHLYPSADLDQYKIASLSAQAKFSGRCDSRINVHPIKAEIEDIDMEKLDIQTGSGVNTMEQEIQSMNTNLVMPRISKGKQRAQIQQSKEVLVKQEPENMDIGSDDQNKEDSAKFSGWSASPTQQPIEVIDVDAIKDVVGEKRQRNTVDINSSSIRPVQRQRLQVPRDGSTKAQIELYGWKKLNDYIQHTNTARAEMDNMPAMCRIIYDLYFTCLKMNDNRDAQVAVGQVKASMTTLPKQPPLQTLQHLIELFKPVNIMEIKNMLTDEDFAQIEAYEAEPSYEDILAEYEAIEQYESVCTCTCPDENSYEPFTHYCNVYECSLHGRSWDEEPDGAEEMEQAMQEQNMWEQQLSEHYQCDEETMRAYLEEERDNIHERDDLYDALR
ncbi:hypothetical protein L210DRAFT_3659079 [Boletus edulis BED1]|uniref:Uncharacterized protein n=1 Tax=Boletus edulis BED1 TaxID=1328754 RepID=A0AAD4BA35_BOLED|nr:hypothetical protein L210DRAFT_3659079 [Boletus edulis BED1]